MLMTIKNKILQVTLMGCLIQGWAQANDAQSMAPAQLRSFIQQLFKDVLEDMDASEETYARYFSQDYKQYVDGKVLTYKDFVAHMTELKKTLQSASVSFKEILVEGNKIAEIHTVHAMKKNGKEVMAQVNAFFTINLVNGQPKIVECNELTYILEGEKSDKDLGSKM